MNATNQRLLISKGTESKANNFQQGTMPQVEEKKMMRFAIDQDCPKQSSQSFKNEFKQRFLRIGSKRNTFQQEYESKCNKVLQRRKLRQEFADQYAKGFDKLKISRRGALLAVGGGVNIQQEQDNDFEDSKYRSIGSQDNEFLRELRDEFSNHRHQWNFNHYYRRNRRGALLAV